MSEIINIEAKEITKEYNEAIAIHQRILANGEVCARSLYEICRDLKRMRDEKLYGALGLESFDNYCEKMLGIRARQGYTYISLLEQYGDSSLQSNASLGVTKLSLIAKINPVERAEKLENGEFANMSVSEIKELIQKTKEQGEQISLLQSQLEEAENAKPQENSETDRLKERIEELEKQISESSGYDAEADKLYDKVKNFEEELRKKDREYKAQLAAAEDKIREQLENEYARQDNSDEIQKQIDIAVESAVLKAKKEAEKEIKAKLKDKSDKQIARIKELEETLTAADTEKERLAKQLALSDTKSSKAMVYIGSIQNNFNELFNLMSDMEDEQQNKFKGAVLKLTVAIQRRAEQ